MENNLENIDWGSEKNKRFYEILNNAYVTIMKSHHPNIKLLYINPYDFAEKVKNIENEIVGINVEVIACYDFDFQALINTKRDIGTDTSKVLYDIVRLLPYYNEVMEGKSIWVNLVLNKTKYCKNLLRYTKD